MLARMGYIISRKRIITLVTYRYTLHKPATHEVGYIFFLITRRKKINLRFKPELHILQGLNELHKITNFCAVKRVTYNKFKLSYAKIFVTEFS